MMNVEELRKDTKKGGSPIQEVAPPENAGI